jgi:hypothetical protein
LELHNIEEDLCSTIIERDFSKDRDRLTKEQLLDKEKYVVSFAQEIASLPEAHNSHLQEAQEDDSSDKKYTIQNWYIDFKEMIIGTKIQKIKEGLSSGDETKRA